MSLATDTGWKSVVLRASGECDGEFFHRVYASTRSDELALVPWSAEAKECFLRQQFQAQDRAYRNDYPGAEFWIVVVDGTDAGRLFVQRAPGEIRIMDIALLPGFRGRGIGTHLLNQILQEAENASRKVTIHVEVFNPAQRLYQRLGFSKVAANEVYCLMEWGPRIVRPETEPNL